MILTLSSGEESQVDLRDGHLSRFTWKLHPEGYAYRMERVDGRNRMILLHRQILGLTDSHIQADHINGDRLDNRRANLRSVTNRANSQNTSARSGYRGVHFSRDQRQWVARCKLNYKHHCLGSYDSEIAAARAAEAFRRVHLPFSQPNLSLDPLPACPCRPCRVLRGEPMPAASIRSRSRHADVRRLLERGGFTTSQIADEIGSSRSFVQRSAKRQGLDLPRPVRWEAAA